MNYHILGKTGLRVSEMGFGGIPVQKVDAATATAIMDALLKEGINYIDSARAYTVSEQLIGEGIRGRRDKFILATKSGAVTAEDMARDIEISLKNFGTDVIDLYQIHNPAPAKFEAVMGKGGALEALLEAKRQGKIRHIGFTTHYVELFEKALEMDCIETIMFPYNLVETQGEELIARCREKNVGFIVMKPLAGGALENVDLAMRFIAANKNISVTIPGVESPEQVHENVKAFVDAAPLSDADKAEIERIRRELGSNFCRRCNYCAPCTAGIAIPSVFLFGGYLERYGLEEWARARYESLPVKASACVECGACEERCPYHLPIREMMKKYAGKFGK